MFFQEYLLHKFIGSKVQANLCRLTSAHQCRPAQGGRHKHPSISSNQLRVAKVTGWQTQCQSTPPTPLPTSLPQAVEDTAVAIHNPLPHPGRVAGSASGTPRRQLGRSGLWRTQRQPRQPKRRIVIGLTRQNSSSGRSV